MVCVLHRCKQVFNGSLGNLNLFLSSQVIWQRSGTLEKKESSVLIHMYTFIQACPIQGICSLYGGHALLSTILDA